MNARHQVRKNFRLTSAEAAKLAAYAQEAEVSEAEYVRTLINNPRHVFTTNKNMLRQLLREYKRQGVNLNQIAHSANIGRMHKSDCIVLDEIAQANARIADAILDALEEAKDANR